MPHSKFHKSNPSTVNRNELWRCNGCGKDIIYKKINNQSGSLATKLHLKKCENVSKVVNTLISVPSLNISKCGKGALIEKMHKIVDIVQIDR